MPSAAKAAFLAPSTVEVRSTRAVSKPGVIVSKPAASTKATSDWVTFMFASTAVIRAAGVPANGVTVL